MSISGWATCAALLLGAALAGSGQLGAQTLRGTVRDSATGQPVIGAVVTLLDSGGKSVRRGITSMAGEYSLTFGEAARRIRVQRIGFRPRDVRVPIIRDGATRLDLVMVPLPTFLEPVRAVASRCPPRPNQSSAITLLEQARSGLLATVVARESNTGAMVRFAYRQRMDGSSDRVEHMSVQSDTANQSAVSFQAALAGRDFAARGFATGGGSDVTYFGPDPDVLLDDAFIAAYCFHVMEPDRTRPNQVGLGFEPADHKRDRIDIEGALWIDTVARALHDIEFRYVGFGREVDAFHPGGAISFQQMPNGVALVDRWRLRLVGAEEDTVVGGPPFNRIARRWLFAQESGGELAHATWTAGQTWNASLGRLQLQTHDRAGHSAAGTVVRLLDTPYEARVDEHGQLEIRDLVPGPYTVAVRDPRLAELGVLIATPFRFVAVRDSIIRATVALPMLEDYARERCEAGSRREMGDTTYIVGRVISASGASVGGVTLSLENDLHGFWRPVGVTYRTGTDGLFHFCHGLTRYARVRVVIDGVRHDDATVVRELDDAVTVIRVTLPPDG